MNGRALPSLASGRPLPDPSPGSGRFAAGNDTAARRARTDAAVGRLDCARRRFDAWPRCVGSGGQSSESLGYLYDGAWNLNAVTNHSSVTGYSVNSQNELTSVAGNSCSYDANGNLTGFSQGGYTYAGTYDDENELASITSYYGGSNYQLSEMSYDGRGRLRVRQDYTWEYGGWYPVASVDYVYDGPVVIQERNYGTPTTYTRGWDLSGSFAGAGGIGGLLGRTTGNSVNGYTSAYYHADGNGNVVSLSDGTQTVVASYRYDPFGNTMAATGTLAAANTYRFSSKDENLNFGLYSYGYRWYAPGLQRWLNRDPAGQLHGINLYDFAGNRATGTVDPNGLWYLTLGIGDLIGVKLVIGRNCGQWNYGAYVGVGEGAFVNLDPRNHDTRRQPGVRFGVEREGAIGLGGLNFDATSHIGFGEDENWWEISRSIPGTPLSGSWGSEGGKFPVVGVGEGTVIGGGGVITF